MILKLEEAKRYLRMEEDYIEEDADVESLVLAAEAYLKKAGCALSAADESSKLAIKMLVNHWHENREPIGSGDRLAFGLSELILQLQYGSYVEGTT
jgi:Phage gp6-like head-tail connector protein